ncbi:MAG: Rieske 2Fe-2S domain-containing protein [Acidobacteriota bacterium]
MEDSLEKYLGQISGLDSAAETVSRGIHDAVLQGGEPARKIADALHGKWLGHPLHPALTDFVVGAFAFGSLFNLAGGELNRKIAQSLIAAGAIAAVPTALAGATDFSTVTRPALNTAAVHGLLNSTALVLYLMSLRNGNEELSTTSRVWSTLGFGVLFVSAWLGGKMTYHYRVGVNKAEHRDGPEEWTPILSANDLGVRQPKRVEFNGTSILLYKQGQRIYAIGAVCAHEGGPLEEGEFFEKEPEGICVECPWHQSVYAVEDGSVVHGPSTYDVTAYEAQVRDGQVEIRLARRPVVEEQSRQRVGELMAE